MLYLQYIQEKVKANMKAEASKSFIGFGWWLFEPLLMLIVFYLVFGVLLQRGGREFIYSLIVGISVWTWFAGSLSSSMLSIIQANKIIGQIYVPKWIFPIILLAEQAYKQIVVFILLMIFLLVFSSASITWWWLPFLVFIQLMVNVALGMLVAAAIPFIPDLRFVIAPGLRMLMFCSGVFYSIDSIPIEFRNYFMLNPIANLIEQYRTILITGGSPELISLLLMLLGASLLILATLLFMKKYDKFYPRLVI